MKKINLAGVIAPAFLVLITTFLFFKNYEPVTWLSGWDTLHPEFDFNLYFKRIVNGVWQEHQGLGAVASQAHASELPRSLIIYLLSIFVPVNLVRYGFFYLSLLLGPLGVYFLCRYVLLRDKEKWINLASFLAATFYLLNLTTLQHFYVPFEMFAAHFALLPWLFYTLIKFLREGKTRNLVYFCIVTIFSASMAHTATLFYVYFLALIAYILVTFIFVRRKDVLKRGALTIFLTLALNSYWILPNVYYVAKHSHEVGISKIHAIFSDEAFLQGKAFGEANSLILQKNFLFNWREFDSKNNQFVDLLNEWSDHLEKPYVKEAGYFLFFLGLSGVFISLFRKSKYTLSLLPLFILAVFFWINSNYPFQGLFDYLREHELFREGLRFPFTKFSILLTFVLAVYFSFTAQFLLEKLAKFRVALIFAAFLFFINAYFMLPAFQGGFLSPSMRVQIPKEYFQAFNWFKERDTSGRIAKLPLNTFWGWNFYNWDYQGAGFTWFGLPQPSLDREFDRWSPYNESFYNESSFALYSNNSEAFERTLEKYQVKYLLLDESVVNAGGSSEILFIPQLKALISASERIKEVQKLGFLTIYETDFEDGDKFISVPEVYNQFDTDSTYSESDTVYYSYGNYVNNPEGTTFPFINFDRRMGVTIENLGDRLLVKSGELQFSGAKSLAYPEFLFGEKEESPRVVVNEEKKVQVSLPIDQNTSVNLLDPEQENRFQNCDLKKLGEVKRQLVGQQVNYLAQNGGVACEFFNFPDLSHSSGYALHIKGENKEGRSLKIYLQNWVTNRMDLEELLPKGVFDEYFFIRPSVVNIEGFLGGYSLSLETRSFGRVSSENTLETVEFIPVPIEWLRQIRLEPEDGQSAVFNNLTIKEVKKTGTWLYKVTTEGEGLMVLGQGYEDGWIAFKSGDFKEKLEHLRFNSWANGWNVPDGSGTIYVLFWPQLLEYLGLILIPFGFIIVLKSRGPKRFDY